MTKIHKKIIHHTTRATKAVHRHAKDHFVPHEGNGHIPHVLRHGTLMGYSAILLLLKIAVVTATIALPTAIISTRITPDNVVKLTNATRQELQIGTLEADPLLTAAAQAKADDMLAKSYFSHVGPEGEMPWKWIKEAGYRYKAAAENLAIHFTEAEDIQDGWLASPTHRQNLINPKYTEIGVGVSEGIFHGVSTIMVVQMFGLPKSGNSGQAQAAKATIEDTSSTTDRGMTTGAKETTEAEKRKGEVAGIAVDEIDEDATPIGQMITTAKEGSDKPVIYDTGAVIIPRKEHVQIEVPISNAVKASAFLGNETIRLVQSPAGDVWTGTIPYSQDDISQDKRNLSIVALNSTGQQAKKVLARVQRENDMKDVFLPEDSLSSCWLTKVLFGRTTERIYVFFILFLCASLIIAISMKERIMRFSHVAHGMAVIALAFMLWKF